MAHVKLHIPGPVEVSEKTLRAFASPMIGHRGQGFKDLYGKMMPQVQSLLLRAMAERSVFAFDREYRFPYMTVFADRNKVAKEAGVDDFMAEATPAGSARMHASLPSRRA